MKRGFTLVELMIVVSVMAVVLAIAIPNLMRVKHNANETGAIEAVRTLSTSLESFRAAQSPQQYPLTLQQMAQSNPPYIPASLTGVRERQGYSYDYTRTSLATYTLQANPSRPGTTGSRFFYVDQTGVIRSSTRGPAGPASSELQ